MKHTCEKCSMLATTQVSDESGLVHYYCEHHVPKQMTQIEEPAKPESNFKKFLPLIVIFSSIVLFTLIASLLHGTRNISFSMRMMMGSFFAIFGFFKIINLRAFADAYSTYDIIAKRSRFYALIYPFFELLLGILYLSNIGGLYRDIFTLILMSVSIIGVLQKIRQKETIACACLGMVFKVPMTWVTLIEDSLMAIEAFIMILLSN